MSDCCPSTKTVRTAIESDQQHGSVIPPIYLSSNYTFEDLGSPRKYDYTRSGNPTRDALAEGLNQLEQGQGAVVTSSGLAAITLVLQLLKGGDHVIAPHDCYGGTYRLMKNLAARGNFSLSFVDQTDVTKANSHLRSETKMIWLETPSNPLLRIVDIEYWSRVAKSIGALLVVDNTFLSPINQKPILLGADIVIHSTTKYLNGHSDVVGGVAIASDKNLAEDLAWWGNCLGLTGAPFDSFLTLRGLRTLHARLRLHEENALAVVHELKNHPLVEKIYHPSLSDHQGHEIAKRQQSGYGSMISLEIKGGFEGIRRFVNNLTYFSLAESLGGVESLVSHPATMTHAAMTEEERQEAGIKPSLIRLSIGIEAKEDLIGDLRRGLDSITQGVTKVV